MARDYPCPHCGCAETFRAHRKPWEHLLLGCRAYLCVDCKSRFLIFELAKVWEGGSAS